MDDLKKQAENEVEKAIEIFIDQGFVTRNQVKSVDLRVFCRSVEDALKEKGLAFLSHEAHLESYYDYSTIIFNPEVMELKDAKRYMNQYVLKHEYLEY